MSGEIPTCDALGEASANSLSELLSRDPEGYSQVDLARVIEAFREQRVKWAAAEAQAPAKRSAGGAKAALSRVSDKSTDDLGL
jgi:hypothetical protein